MSPIFCRAVRTTLAARVLDTGQPPGFLERHVSVCLRCQAVTAQTLRLRRTLASLDPVDRSALEAASSNTKWVVAGLASVAAALVASRLRQSIEG